MKKCGIWVGPRIALLAFLSFSSVYADSLGLSGAEEPPLADRSGVEAPFSEPILVSTAKDGASSGNSSSGLGSVSGNGRFLVFQSFATDLVSAADENQDWDFFRRDLVTGATDLVSVSFEGASTGDRGVSGRGYASSDGRFVAFSSAATDLVAADTNKMLDAFVRDMDTGHTSLVSVNLLGTDSGNGGTLVSGISDDGRYVLFESGASDLVENDTNSGPDVYVRDLKLGKTILVSVNKAGTASADGGAGWPHMTPDGRFVLYLGYWDDHVAEDSNQAWDVFVRDLKTKTTILASVNREGTVSASGFSEPVAISREGRRVAFVSRAADLVGRDTNETDDLFVRDLARGETMLVSVNSIGDDSGTGRSWVERDLYRENLFSADGRFLVFQSEASDLVSNDPDPWSYDVFVRDLEQGVTHLVSEGPDGLASHDNTWVCCYAMSPEGRHVAFGSPSPVFAAPGMVDSNGAADLFLRDLTSGSTSVVSRSARGDSTADRESLRPLFSADGGFLFFESLATDMVEGDDNGNYDLFLVVFDSSTPPSPPAGDWLSSTSLPGYGFKVLISAGSDSRPGAEEPSCIPETLCVSGAVPGRSEVFLRVVGPKPNGRMWPTLVKFSTSTVEVWVRQDSSGEVRFYRLEGARPGFDELPGLFDREGFFPDAGAASALTAFLGLTTADPRLLAGEEAPPPSGAVFTSEHFPDFRFRARITAGGQVQEVRKEVACIEETLCLSGALPGRSEVFVRIVGPKPNGRLWPTVVKFTTSTVEVWIEQISTGESKYYRIEGAAPGKDDLTGLFDRDGFAP